jgi:GNAT superfamily N-acetyltransferase
MVTALLVVNPESLTGTRGVGTEFVLARDILGTAPGYVQLRYRHSMWTSAPEAELEDVFVVGEARRRGVGRRLVEFAIAHALDRGCRSIGLNTNEHNIGALALYQQCDFVAEHVRWEGGLQFWLLRRLEPA